MYRVSHHITPHPMYRVPCIVSVVCLPAWYTTWYLSLSVQTWIARGIVKYRRGSARGFARGAEACVVRAQPPEGVAALQAHVFLLVEAVEKALCCSSIISWSSAMRLKIAWSSKKAAIFLLKMFAITCGRLNCRKALRGAGGGRFTTLLSAFSFSKPRRVRAFFVLLAARRRDRRESGGVVRPKRVARTRDCFTFAIVEEDFLLLRLGRAKPQGEAPVK